jgi:CheY-like chemotaxis protein
MPGGREMSPYQGLLVDDDEVVRLTLSAMMREDGFEITTEPT